MRLLEAILKANDRRVAGDSGALVATAELAAALPVAALTCIDPGLNRLLPSMLGIPDDEFIWIRNAGNLITGPLSSTMRSLALACAIKGAKEILVIGQAECEVGKTTALQLLERFAAIGVQRNKLPENLAEYFAFAGSERQSVIRSVEHARASPLVGATIPIHGMLIDVKTGRVEVVVNGYEAAGVQIPRKVEGLFQAAEQSLAKLENIGRAVAEELKLPDTKVGEIVSVAEKWLDKAEVLATKAAPAAAHLANRTAPPTTPADPLATLQERMRQFSARPKRRK